MAGPSRLVTGARVVCAVNGRAYGRVSRVGWVARTPAHVVHGIDTLLPVEIAPQAATITGSMTVYKVIRDGGVEASGMVPTWEDLPRGKWFSMLLVDRVTDSVVLRVDQCWALEQAWDVPTRGFVTGTVQFVGWRWGNETQPSAGQVG